MSCITVYLLEGNRDGSKYSRGQLSANACVGEIRGVSSLTQTRVLKEIADRTSTPYVLLFNKPTALNPGTYALERFIQVIEMTGAALAYSDYRKERNGVSEPNPTIEYQAGSLRDDFDFGSLLFFRTDVFREAVAEMPHDYSYAALYDLRLRLSRKGTIVRIPEFLYTEVETDHRLSGEKQFDYVDPKNRNVQLEMEAACTSHLKAVGGYMEPRFTPVTFQHEMFPVEASVIIPVKNRIKTIRDAVLSALSQRTDFAFNLIVADNHSTDGTTDVLHKLSLQHPGLVHFVPERKDLGIGGCWTAAAMHEKCGKFAIQLDSDDLYINNGVIQQIVNGFYKQSCAMLIGAYQMVNFNLEEIPPGIIDHKEWTPDNGRNNALRINGLGAPRAFYTPVLRQLKMPDVSYGEDYATALAISREYRIGRIYEPLYLCRRWEENTDSALDVTRLNTYNFYKDKIRTYELSARQAINRQEK